MKTEANERPITARYFVGTVEADTEFAAVITGDLMGLPVFKEIAGDPVLGGRFIYVDGGWNWVSPCPRRPIPADPENANPPQCAADCRYLQIFSGFDLQRNALRTEMASMVSPERCGWNLLPGRLGGHPLDYSPCISVDIANAKLRPEVTA